MDVVIQDNFNGARLAARWLISQGHHIIGWLGPCRVVPHFSERFAGAWAGLRDSGLGFNPAHVIEVPSQNSVTEAVEGMQAVLKKPGRPTAFLCMWQKMTLAAAKAVREAGLTFGKDIELTGWGTELDYRQRIAPEFLGGETPACVLWDPDEMAALSLDRLEQRILNPGLPTCRTDVKVRIEKPRPASMVLQGVS